MANFYKATSSTKGAVVLRTASYAQMVSHEGVSYGSSSGAAFGSVAEIIAGPAPGFDNTFTMFCRHDYDYNNLLAVGFSGAYLLDPGEIITMANGSKIQYNASTGRLIYSDSEDVEKYTQAFSGSGGSTASYMFPSPTSPHVVVNSGNEDVWAAVNALPQSEYYFSTLEVISLNPNQFHVMGQPYNPGSSPKMFFYRIGYGSISAGGVHDWYIGLDPDLKDDPYEPGGESTTGGGEGTFDGTSELAGIPPLPTISATDTGFITLFHPTLTQLQNLANYMWSDSLFDIDTWKKLFADPMDAILGLSVVPISIPSGGQAPVSVGNIQTDITMDVAGAQYIELDCGTLNIQEYWEGYLDYDPYTKIQIYLPYIGIHPIKADDIMGKSVKLVYHVDILSGACVAYLECNGSVLYSFLGQCSASIPITGNDWTNVINGVINAAASIGSMVATGGMSAPTAIPSLAASVVNGLKPEVERSGNISSAGGILAKQTPYLIVTRPRQCLPSAQNTFTGYPSYITVTLGKVKGYTEVDTVHLNGIGQATESELTEIENLLKSGVIL